MMLNKLRTFLVAYQTLDEVEIRSTEVHQLAQNRLMVWFHFPALCFYLGSHRLLRKIKNGTTKIDLKAANVIFVAAKSVRISAKKNGGKWND